MSIDSQVIWELFPCTITLPDGSTHKEVRVFATAEVLYMAEASGRKVVVFYNHPYTEFRLPTHEDPAAHFTVNGQDMAIIRAGGCGCSNPCKGTNGMIILSEWITAQEPTNV